MQRTSTKWWRRFPVWVLVIVLVLVGARAALPWVLKTYINKTMNSIPGYYGGVDDVDVALYRGAYSIEGIKLVKIHGDPEEPFVSIREVEIALDWRALLDRRLVTKIALDKPQLQFIQRATAAASQTNVDESWQDKVTNLYPFEINSFIIREGLVRYKDNTRDPKINLYVHDLNLDSENISNTTRSSERLPSSAHLTANFLNTGHINVRAKANALKEPPEFDVNASLKDLSLKEINDFAKAYGNFDFEKGELEAALELAASKTRYDGYAKTVMKGVDIVDLSKEMKEGDSIGHLLWEGLVGAISEIFQNQRRDQFAARIPIAGTRAEMKFDSWSTLGSVLRNAFVQALNPRLEESIDFSDANRKPASK